MFCLRRYHQKNIVDKTACLSPNKQLFKDKKTGKHLFKTAFNSCLFLNSPITLIKQLLKLISLIYIK